MKRALLLGLLLAALPHAWADPEEPAPGPSTVTVEIEGLACPFCVYGLERQFGRLQGVERADVDLGEGRATLKLKPGAKLTEAQIREAVRKAGFKASEIKGIEERSDGRTRSFNGTIRRSGDGFVLLAADEEARSSSATGGASAGAGRADTQRRFSAERLQPHGRDRESGSAPEAQERASADRNNERSMV